MMYEEVAQSDEYSSYKELKLLLQKELHRNIQLEEAVELGECFVSFYNALASQMENVGEQD